MEATSARPQPSCALAIGAHPDDIEFYMAGTLLLLRQAGWKTHYLNLSSGNCGSQRLSAQATRRVRSQEARRAARCLQAHYHPSLADDLEILYELRLLRRLAAVIRRVRASVILTHSPQDYMEDHTNTCRLSVTAAFARGMPNFRTSPAQGPAPGDVTIYHAMPHGLHDELRRRVIPGAFVNTTTVHAKKREALGAHQSQKAWLDASQGMDSYLLAMDEMSLKVGRMSREFRHAEGWRRHLHLGFSEADHDPLADALGRNYRVNRSYEKELKRGS
jgi:LmbE family N-acetylglucosaminyl deacetylase